MKVKLKVLTKSLQVGKGPKAGRVVEGDKQRYFLGSGDDCHLCCKAGAAIHPRHCEVVVSGQQVAVKNLDPEHKTFVNGQPIESQQILRMGDRLRIGNLELSVLIDDGSSVQAASVVEEQDADTAVADEAASVGENVSDWLLGADEAERARRMQNPDLRRLKVDATQGGVSKDSDEQPDKNDPAEKKTKPEKKEPGKLPPRPKVVADDSIDAASDALRKMFGTNYRPPLK
jgi:predicted component of type VI protein secretion system